MLRKAGERPAACVDNMCLVKAVNHSREKN